MPSCVSAPPAGIAAVRLARIDEAFLPAVYGAPAARPSDPHSLLARLPITPGTRHRNFRLALTDGADKLCGVSTRLSTRATVSLSGLLVLAAVFVGGLYYVKWSPYYHKAVVAAERHSIGASIVSGERPAPPRPSLEAALGYAWAYGKSVWQAMVLGLVVGAGVQVLVPRDWLARLFGRMTFTGVALAGLVSTASMM